MMIVHIRAGDVDCSGLCGIAHAGESISQFHFFNHVVDAKDECCKELFARLCVVCLERVNEVP